jgi:hypothetical protein
MKTSKKHTGLQEIRTWEEESGLLEFLSSVHHELSEFNDKLGFGIEHMVAPLSDIDADTSLPRRVGFVLKRNNPLVPEFTYCLYSLLEDRLLHGYIGICRDGSVKTVKQLEPIRDFRKGKEILYDWLRQLVRASCEKIMI